MAGQASRASTPAHRRRRRDVVRDNRVTVRFSDEEYERVTANAAATGLAVAAYLARLGTVPLPTHSNRGRHRPPDGTMPVDIAPALEALRHARQRLEGELDGELDGELTAPRHGAPGSTLATAAASLCRAAVNVERTLSSPAPTDDPTMGGIAKVIA